MFENPWGDDKDVVRPKFGKNSEQKKPGQNSQKIDDLVKQFTKYKNNGNGGGNGSGQKNNGGPNLPSDLKSIIFYVLPIALIIWFATGFYTIQPDEKGVILRFGKYHNTSEPGLNYRLPAPIDKLIKVNVTKINSVEVGYRNYGRQKSSHANESVMLTGDENIVDVKFEVQWQIKSAYDFLFEVRDDQAGITVKNSAESAMREVIGKSNITFILAEGRSSIEQEAKMLLQEILDSYKSGIDVKRLQLLDVDPPPQVIDAFRDVQTAKADKERAINQAESYSNDIIPRARGEASQIIEDAKAYSQQVVADAKGKADRFKNVYSEYRKARTVTKKRIYLDTMQKVLDSADVTIIDKNSSNTGVIPYLSIQK